MAKSMLATVVGWNNVTLTAGAGDTVLAAQDISGNYATGVCIKLTNGATGPTVAAQVLVEVSQDGTNFYGWGGALKGSTANNGIVPWPVSIPGEYKYFRASAGSNTGQNVTVRLEYSAISGL